MEGCSPHLRGKLFLISGPSGVGKTVLCNEMVKRFAPNVVYSISATSRPPRGQEKDGQEYFFCLKSEFQTAIESDRFAEWACVHGNYYGTPRVFLQEQMDRGKFVILNIDVQGARKIRDQYPESVMIFILPPSIEILEKRIRNRGTESEEDLRQRMENARAEIAFKNEYSHVVVNDDLGAAVEMLEKIFQGYFSVAYAND